MRWAARQRQKWILERLTKAGHINRGDLVKEFGISEPTASADFLAFQAANPGVMSYDLSAKRYVLATATAQT